MRDARGGDVIFRRGRSGRRWSVSGPILWRIDERNRIVSCAGAARGALLGLRLDQVVHPSDRDRVLALAALARQRHRIYYSDYVAIESGVDCANWLVRAVACEDRACVVFTAHRQFRGGLLDQRYGPPLEILRASGGCRPHESVSSYRSAPR